MQDFPVASSAQLTHADHFMTSINALDLPPLRWRSLHQLREVPLPQGSQLGGTPCYPRSEVGNFINHGVNVKEAAGDK